MPADSVKRLLRPILRRLPYATVEPGPLLRPLYASLFRAQWVSRELLEWAERALIATPAFLARCASHGTDITCDRLPYLIGNVSIYLGSQIRISGKLDIISPHSGAPVLRIGNGVFIGHGTALSVARSVEIGDYVSIGAGSSIADTEGHNTYNPMRPIWEVPAGPDDVESVVIEDNVQIGKKVTILKGVRIGARSVIGAGAVVRSNIPADSVVMGNPGRVVRSLKPAASQSSPNLAATSGEAAAKEALS
ncbi:MAG: acyltransferase [Polyangiaceae bacterium]|nr:acyltransferase [Polyangiaceae bacterium]